MTNLKLIPKKAQEIMLEIDMLWDHGPEAEYFAKIKELNILLEQAGFVGDEIQKAINTLADYC
jgi:hypothetical protein